jgi:hypothetical protein
MGADGAVSGDQAHGEADPSVNDRIFLEVAERSEETGCCSGAPFARAAIPTTSPRPLEVTCPTATVPARPQCC